MHSAPAKDSTDSHPLGGDHLNLILSVVHYSDLLWAACHLVVQEVLATHCGQNFVTVVDRYLETGASHRQDAGDPFVEQCMQLDVHFLVTCKGLDRAPCVVPTFSDRQDMDE